MRRRSSRVRGWGLCVAVGMALFAACSTERPPLPGPGCPNDIPQAGAACAGDLRCTYQPPECADYVAALCIDGTWSIDRDCAPGTGGGGAGKAGEGGEGGMGGNPCVDSIAGPPEVISPVSVLKPPDAGSGFYALQFSEAVSGVATHVSWSGPGALESVAKIGATYRVYYSGLEPGDAAILTVDGVTDSCGTPMARPVEIELRLRPSCHYLSESFEGPLASAGWSSADHAGDGNHWAISDERDVPNGVPNHSGGSGLCATANDVDSAPTTTWNAELASPVIDLSGGADVVLRFRSDFKDPLGQGSAIVEGSPDGSSWQVLRSWSEDRGPDLESVDVSDFAGGPLYLRFRYLNEGGLGAWWDLDDVCVEEFTKASCPCPPGGITEVNDVAGVLNGNGGYVDAELTPVTLTSAGQRVTVCGTLEEPLASGADYFSFVVSSSVLGPAQGTVSYCIENGLEDATVGMWVKSILEPLASEPARNEGQLPTPFENGLQHFVALSAGPGYKPSRYAVTVELGGVAAPLLGEGFEQWPPLALTPTDEDACLEWAQASSTVVPFGELPTEGSSLAFFNSYDCLAGSESLESAPLSFSGKTSVMLSFDMFHDTAYPGSLDSIQVEYNTGSGWIPIGPEIVRPDVVQGWRTESVDLSSLAGSPAVRIRLRATSYYGSNVHIDNVAIYAF